MNTTELTEAPAIESLYHRAHEVLVRIMAFEPWQRCQHGKQIVIVRAHWSDDAPFTVTTGEINHTQVFDVTRHADGSVVFDHSYDRFDPKPSWADGLLVPEFNQVSKCDKCGELNTLSTVQEAYGNRTTCSACGNSNWYSIGD